MTVENLNMSETLDVLVPTITPAGRANVIIKRGEERLLADQVNAASEKSRKEFLNKVQKRLPGIEQGQLRDIEDQLIFALERLTVSPGKEADKTEQHDAAELLRQMPEEVRNEAKNVLENRMLLKLLIDDVALLGIAGERELVATVYHVGTSRLLSAPLAAIIQGPSSSGKSYLIDNTTSLFPPEAVIHATQMTPQALYYMPPGSLVHRFIVAGERSRIENDEAIEATRALRQMISERRLSKLISPKSPEGGIHTVHIEQEGPIAYIESTTSSKILDEDLNRCLLLHTDERPEQTRRVVRRQAVTYSKPPDPDELEHIIQRHHALQRMLEPLPVVVPYADRVAELFTSTRVEARRVFPHLMSMVKASALLYQLQRERDSDGCLVASEDDYQIARWLLISPVMQLLGGGISAPARRFLDRLRGRSTDMFTTTEAIDMDRVNVSARSVRGWLTDLREAGIAEIVEPNKGPKPAVCRLTGKTPEEVRLDGSELPTVEQVFSNPDFRLSNKTQVLSGTELKSAAI